MEYIDNIFISSILEVRSSWIVELIMVTKKKAFILFENYLVCITITKEKQFDTKMGIGQNIL